MNKDVIYIEPEDDITDIIAKIEKSKAKIVALVPPKKAGVFRSIVNIKLIAKAGVSADKNIVLVTVDPSITKLAAATKIPVTKNLQSAPSVPVITDEEDSNPEPEEVTEEPSEESTEKANKKAGSSKVSAKHSEDESEEDDDEDDVEEEAEAEEVTKKKEPKKKNSKNNKFLEWIQDHKKLTIFSGIIGVFLIVFLVWAFGFAPAVEISVAIKTDSKNFSESATFTTNLTDEDAKEGKFFIEQKKIEEVKEVEFEATGTKNLGEKAKGEIVIYAYFRKTGTVAVNAGQIFTVSGLSFAADSNASLSWGGDLDSCENKAGSNGQDFFAKGCLISGRVKVTATQSGVKYNIGAKDSGWDTVADVYAYSDKAMSGGTDNIVTVVQQSDVEKAKENLTSSNESENKTKLFETIDENSLIIEESFKQETSAATSTPAIDAEVKDGEKAVLKATTTATVYVIDKVKLEEFIREKAKLDDSQKIYEIEDVRIENFSEVKNGGYTAKIKAHYYVGPKVTESELVDKILGKGLGDARREINDIYGVSDVVMNPSYPWVMSVPTDSNKVKISFEIKDQDGKEIKDQDNNSQEEEKND